MPPAWVKLMWVLKRQVIQACKKCFCCVQGFLPDRWEVHSRWVLCANAANHHMGSHVHYRLSCFPPLLYAHWHFHSVHCIKPSHGVQMQQNTVIRLLAMCGSVLWVPGWGVALLQRTYLSSALIFLSLKFTSCRISFARNLLSPSSTCGLLVDVTWPRSPVNKKNKKFSFYKLFCRPVIWMAWTRWERDFFFFLYKL